LEKRRTLSPRSTDSVGKQGCFLQGNMLGHALPRLVFACLLRNFNKQCNYIVYNRITRSRDQLPSLELLKMPTNTSSSPPRLSPDDDNELGLYRMPYVKPFDAHLTTVCLMLLLKLLRHILYSINCYHQFRSKVAGPVTCRHNDDLADPRQSLITLSPLVIVLISNDRDLLSPAI
jgi:hypothetical protein